MKIEEFPDTAGLSAEEIELLAYMLEEEGIEALQQQSIPASDRRGDLPLSFAQERLWFLDQWRSNDPAYNIPVALSLRGPLDIAGLRRSLGTITGRHESLRTTFTTVAGAPVQVIAPAREGVGSSARLPLIDLGGLPESERAAKAQRLAIAEGRRTFDLARGPLLRCVLLRLGANDHVLLLIMHHIISDGWSLGVFFRELSALYGAEVSGKTAALAALPIQYADFAIWQRAWLLGEGNQAESPLQSQLAYWRQRLSDLPVLELPTDHPRPAIQSSHGARYPFQFPRALADSLSALSQGAGATEFMTLLAAFQTLLARYSDQDDIAIGVPIANRTRPEIEGLIGFFVNTLVLRADLAGDPTFSALLRQVRELTLEAYAHQDLPFEKLVEDLHPDRDLSRTPLFQVSLAVQNTGMQALELRGVAADVQMIDNGTAKFDLALIVEETGARLAGVVEYNTDLFEPATIARLLSHFQVLLESAIAGPGQRLADLPLLTAAERTQLLVAWNPAPLPASDGASFPAQVAAQAARAPDTIALVVPTSGGDQHLTYRELNRHANRLAHYLGALGVGPEVRVGLCVERGLELVIGMLGVLKAGGAYVPLDPAAPAERLAFMLEDSHASVLVTNDVRCPEGVQTNGQGSNLSSVLRPSSFVDLQVIDLHQDWARIASSSAEEPRQAPAPESLAYLIYTSGTTGQPKAVLAEHRQLTQFLAASQREFGFAPGAVIPWVAPTVFDITLFELGLPLATGGTVLVLSREQVLDIPALLATLARCTMLHCVPSLMQQIVAAVPPPAARTYDQLRSIFVGGEAVPPALLAALPAVFRRAEAWVLYGPTEATILSTSCRVAEERALERPLIGWPLPHAQVYVLDPRGQLAPVGVAGELCVGGAGVTRGYHNRPDLTAERFVPNPFAEQVTGYRLQVTGNNTSTPVPCSLSPVPSARLYKTGDRVRYRVDGMLEFMGRIDDQVKVRGFRIELGEVEAVLAQHRGVRAAAVLAREDVPGAVRLVAYVVPMQGIGNREQGTGNEQGADTRSASLSPVTYHLSPMELRTFMQNKLPEYMIPSAFVLLDALPLLTNGKLDRKALPAPDPDPGADAGYAAPRNPLEELLASQWASVLGLPRVGINDSFFALGGHSLLATQLLVRLRQALQVQLPVRALFEAPTVAALAERVVAARRAAEPALLAPPLQPTARDTPPPLAFAQERLWFLDQLAPGNPFYNTALSVRMDGRLDLAAFAYTLSTITRRHAVLRTTFAAINGRPAQIIAPPRPLALRLLDLRLLPDEQRMAAAQLLATEEARRPFDLVRGPMLRAGLLRLDEAEHLLLLTAHHSIFDGWSTAVFVREVQAIYGAFVQGQPNPLSPPPIQYADYAIWQRDWLQGAVLEAELAFWREQLRSAPAALELPTDYPRPAAQTFRGARITFTLAPELAHELIALSRRAGVTLFMLLLAAWQVLLARYSGQDDLCVGVPIAGRTQAELEGLIGFFVNTLVIRGDLSGNPTFHELLERIRSVVLGAYEHQDVPFEMVVEAVQPARSLSHAPLFQTMFTLQNMPQTSLDLPGLTLRPLDIEGGVTLFDLILGLMETEDGLTGALLYSTDLFAETTIWCMLSQFMALLEGIVADPQQRLADLPLAGEAERRQLLAGWSDTAIEVRSQKSEDSSRSEACLTPTELPASDARCIHHLFEAQVERTPDVVALVFVTAVTKDEGRRTNNQRPTTNDQRPTNGRQLPTADCRLHLTYRELNRNANRLAHTLRRMGVGPEAPVGICLEPSPELMISLLGVHKAGGACLWLGPTRLGERLPAVVREARPAVVITEQRWRTNLPAQDTRLLYLDTDRAMIARSRAENPTGGATPGSLAHVMLARDADGETRRLPVEHGQLCSMARAQIRAADIWPGSRVLPYLADLDTLCLPLLAGATLCLAAPGAAAEETVVRRLAQDHAATTLLLPPALLGALSPAQMPALRTLIVLGADASNATLERWASDRTVCVAAGPPEASFWAPFVRETPARQRLVVGPPSTPARLYLLDVQGQPASIGMPGELYIGGASLARGYLDRPDLTAARFVPNPFSQESGVRSQESGVRSQESGVRSQKTNDERSHLVTLSPCHLVMQAGTRLYKTGERARALPDGRFELFGPRDRYLHVRGFLADRQVIVDSLNRHPAVRESVVVVRDAGTASRLVAYIVRAEGTGEGEQETEASRLPTGDERRTTNDESESSSFVVRHSSFVSEVRTFLKERLPDYMLPAAIITLDRLPLTHDGALDLAALPAPATETGPATAQGAATGEPTADIALRQANLSARRAELSSAKRALLEQRLRGKQIRTTTWSPVVAIQPAGTRRPFFCVHPVGGTVLCYVDLARELGDDQPFYGLQAAGLEGSRAPITRIEDMAGQYLEALRGVQPSGPYLLGGWSLGGVVAFEMAQRLQQRGEAVTLFMIDCMAPVPLNTAGMVIEEDALMLGFVRDLASRLGKPAPVDEAELRQRPADARMLYLIERARQSQLLPPEVDVAQLQRMFQVYKTNLEAMVAYQPQLYSGPMTLLRAEEELYRSLGDRTLGWGAVANGPVAIEIVPGSHYTMLNPPLVRTLAACLGPLLAAAYDAVAF